MTISKIEWINFQPHRVSIIKPSKALTVIVGTSRNGKSSLVRGLKWAIENKPRGEDFKNWDVEDKESVAVGIVFEEGHISRERTVSYNQYHTSTLGKPLRAIRSDVPEEVSNITQMSSINIQSQHDPYFMLQPPYSPGEIGRMLNEAVGLEIIDIYRETLASIIRKTRTDIDVTNEIVGMKEKELKQYSRLDEMGGIIEALEALMPQVNETQLWITTVGKLLGEIHAVESELGNINKILGIRDEATCITELIQQIISQRQENQYLNELLQSISSTESDLKDINRWLEIREIHTEMMNIAGNVSNLRLERGIIEKILRDIHQTENAAESGSEALSALYSDRDELFEQLSICPFCHQPITENIRRHIKEMG